MLDLMLLTEKIVSIIAPHNCLICSIEGELLCRGCLADAALPLPPRCYSCRAQSADSAVCPKCRRHSPLSHVWVCADYEGVAKKLVHHFKFGPARSGAKLIAEIMADRLPYLNETVLVPVPTATSRVRERGFDHALLLAINLSELIDLPYSKALFRLNQAKQVGRNRTERRSQLAGTLEARTNLAGQHILLVDDVVTTGATIEEAARTLKKAGAKTVDAVVFAQKM